MMSSLLLLRSPFMSANWFRKLCNMQNSKCDRGSLPNSAGELLEHVAGAMMLNAAFMRWPWESRVFAEVMRGK